MKIAIIGSGSMGSLYGGILAEAGNDVYLIDVFEAHVNSINEKGLCIVENGVERYIKNVRATTDASEVGKVDLAIVFVKSTITDIAVKQNSAVFDENTIVLTLQNGLGNIEKIATVVDEKQIIAGTSANGASMIEPGKINRLMIGVVLVGTCPGGTASNVITYLAGGDVALSVAMTTFSTILAPILTPAITYLLIRESIEFSPVGMFISILQVVILPIALGLAVKYILKEKSKVIEEYMPGLSSLAISCTVAGVISGNVDTILSSLGIVVVVVVMHNILGITLGFCIGKFTGMGRKKSITLGIEVGLQNSGLAASLAATHFPTMPIATVPGALFSAWQNIAGSIFAWYMKSNEVKSDETEGENLKASKPETI